MEPITIAPLIPQSPVAAKLWDEILPILEADGLIAERHSFALSQLCECYADGVRAREELQRETGGNSFYTDRRGFVRQHPAYMALSDADRRMHAWLGEFALSPKAARAFRELAKQRPQAEEVEPADDETAAPIDYASLTREERAAIRAELDAKAQAT